MIFKTTSILVSLLIAFALPYFFGSQPPLTQLIEQEKACVNHKIDSFLKQNINRDTLNVDTIR